MGMYRLTPFAQLDSMTKSASEPFRHAPQYLPGRVPMQTIAPTAAPGQGEAGKGWTWGDTGQLALDIAAGSNPFTGVPYYGYKAVNDFKNGNIWSGLGNMAWGAASFLPGAGSAAKGIVGGISRGAAKMTPGFIKGMQTGGKLSTGMAKGISTGSLVGGLGATGMGMFTGEGGQQTPQQTPQQPDLRASLAPPGAGPNFRTMGAPNFIDQATQDIKRRGLSMTQ